MARATAPARAAEYSAGHIVELEFLEAVRRRPGMYIGNNAAHGLHHLLLEVLDNAVDEAMAGHATRIRVTIAPDGAVTIDDDGRGIPVEWQGEAGMSALTQVLVRPHAGAKFGGDGAAYSTSGGLHGIGLKCTNAFAEFLEVSVRRHGLVFRQRFVEGGVPETPVEIVDATGRAVGVVDERTTWLTDRGGLATHLRVGRRKVAVEADKALGSGTTVRFRPRRAWFSREMDWPTPEAHVPWDAERLDDRFRQIAHLYPGVRIEYTDLRGDRSREATYHSERGLEDYIAYLTEDLEPLHAPVVFSDRAAVPSTDGCGGEAEVRTEVALQYAGEDTQIYSFVNGIPTPLGGTHVSAFRAGLSRALRQFATSRRLLKDGDDLRSDDTLLGLTAVISLSMSCTPQFLSQTKESLNSPEVYGPVLSATYNHLTAYLDKARNAPVGRLLVHQALAAARGREAAAQARRLVIKRSAMDAGEYVLGKLADVQRRGGQPVAPLEHTTIYLVEGDSAGGSCKQGRDSRYHAILPLRGKIPNVEKGSLNALLKNKEIAAIVAALGTGVGADIDVGKLRYGRVSILCDADVDGAHIATLLITLFWRLMRPIIEAGRLYIAQPPLYLVRNRRTKAVRYAYNEEERRRIEAAWGGAEAVDVQRYKGLGEMNPEQLRETVFALPDGLDRANGDGKAKGRGAARQVRVEDIVDKDVRVVIEDVKRTRSLVEKLMGSTVAPRREWLLETDWSQAGG
jgi:DNA gyrase subunit B